MKINSMVGVAVGAMAGLLLAAPAAAHHATPTAEVATGDCGEVTITTTWGADEHQVDTAALVVLVGDEVHTAPIGESITVGPFEADTTVQYRVWGGGERDYDDPPLADLGELVEWLRDNPGQELHPDAPGVAWHSLEVTGCPEPDPTTPPTTPTPTTPPADDDDTAGGTGGGDADDSDTLPVTGSPALLLAGGAVLLLTAGTAVYLAARRRRVTFTA